MDSNHRSKTQQIYSLPPLATRELLQMKLCAARGAAPNRSPAKRVRFGKETQRRERALVPARKRAIQRLCRCGAGGRIRTPDLLITNQLLYRLSYTSTWRLSTNSERYYNKESEVCQVEKKIFFAPPLWDIQRQRPGWLCARCGEEQYSFDRGGSRHGRLLCARCLRDKDKEDCYDVS